MNFLKKVILVLIVGGSFSFGWNINVKAQWKEFSIEAKTSIVTEFEKSQ